MAVSPQLMKAREAFEKRPPAEKFIVLLVLLSLVGWLYLTFVSDPFKAEIALAEQQIASAESRTLTMRLRAERAEESSQEDPNRAAREQLERLVVQETQTRTELSNLVGSVVSPARMNSLLTSVLDLHPGLNLLKVQNHTPSPLAGGQGSQGIYRHGLTVEFQGDYLSTLSYLVYVETLSEGFYWNSIVMTPGEWPLLHILLEIHTISQDEVYLGV